MATVALREKSNRTVRARVEDLSRKMGFLKHRHGVPITLKEPLRIRFSISATWNVNRDLLPCECEIPFGDSPFDDSMTLKSVNSAFQKITEIVEPDRLSRGGTVYDGIYYRDTGGNWQPLKVRREELYAPHKRKYEDAVQKYKDGTPSPVRPPERFSDFVAANSDEFLDILRRNKEDHAELLQSLSKLFENTNIAVYKNRIKEFEDRLRVPSVGAHTETDWQDWIYKNSWMFASQYGAPFPKERVGFDKIPDFLFPTLDGYIDVLEIKIPPARILMEDTSHPGAFRWSMEASSAIGQVMLYLDEIESNRVDITERIEARYSVSVSTLRPRGIILMGQTAAWKRPELDSLRRLNGALHSVEIISYTALLQRAKGVVSLFEEDLRLRS
jgi:hypothetical protein